MIHMSDNDRWNPGPTMGPLVKDAPTCHALIFPI